MEFCLRRLWPKGRQDIARRSAIIGTMPINRVGAFFGPPAEFSSGRPGIACPFCSFSPHVGLQWRCWPDGSGGDFDTFATQAKCPHCEAQFPWTQCPACHKTSPHKNWYRSPSAGIDMRALCLFLLVLPFAGLSAQTPAFSVCKPVAERKADLGCWILTDKSVGRAKGAEVYWHLDSYRDSTQAVRASGGHGVVIHSLGKTWLMTIARARPALSHSGTHVASIGPLHVKKGTEYSALFMEAIFKPGMTSAVHRHSGPEAWYTVAGETCLETPQGKIVGRPGHPAIVPQGPPMFLTATGTHERRAITLILHDASKAATTMEAEWKPRGLCK